MDMNGWFIPDQAALTRVRLEHSATPTNKAADFDTAVNGAGL
jgi:hypothetical protein